jgi:hypothetical protein
MAFLFQDQNQGIRNDAPRGMRLSRPFSFIRTLTVGFGIAPNLLTLFPRENSGKKALAGLGLGHPYRRWGLSPRPENIGRPIWATYWELWRMAAAPASTFAIGNRQVPMPPPRNSGVVAVRDFDNYGRRSDPRGANSARRTRMPRIRFRFVLLLIIRARDQLWTGRALPVDGLPVRLRGFRKSHHLIPTGPGRSGDCSRQRRVRPARVGLPCAYQPSYLNSQM